MTEQTPKPDASKFNARKKTVAPGSAQARRAVENLKRLRKGTTLGGLNWKELRDEGRK